MEKETKKIELIPWLRENYKSDSSFYEFIENLEFDNKILEDLPTNFNSQYFFDPLHANIYEACISLTDVSRLADPLTLKNYLNDNNFL